MYQYVCEEKEKNEQHQCVQLPITINKQKKNEQNAEGLKLIVVRTAFHGCNT